MKYECKYLNEAVVKEIDDLIPDHKDALVAFGAECINVYKEGRKATVFKGVVMGSVLAAVGISIWEVGRHLNNKLKEKREAKLELTEEDVEE